LRLIKDSTIRPLYEGPLKISSKVEYKERLRRMYGDKFNNDDFELALNASKRVLIIAEACK